MINSEPKTGGGAAASIIPADQKLRRAVLACMLWEDMAYESGVSNAANITSLVGEVEPKVAASIAYEARQKQNLRSAPLLVVLSMIGKEDCKPYVADAIDSVIQRPDEIAKLLKMYQDKNGKGAPLSNQMKRGLAKAFRKFNSEYVLGKYKNGVDGMTLRDAMFLVHPKPVDENQAVLFKKLANKELATPDTWETNLSSGKDKKETFSRLIQEKKLGALAFLRNLRNMAESGVDARLIREGLAQVKTEKVLPFRFISANRTTGGQFQKELEDLMLKSLREGDVKLKGHTIIAVDVSGSMEAQLSGKSDLTREDAGAALAILVKEISDSCTVYATGNKTVRVNDNLHGFALANGIKTAGAGYGGIYLKPCVEYIHGLEKECDQMIVITDGQDCGRGNDSPTLVQPFAKHNYLMDIAAHKNGIGYEKFTVINGFSEALVHYVAEDIRLFG